MAVTETIPNIATSGAKNPYGLDHEGRYKTIGDLNPEHDFGLACNLSCPECGAKLMAIRAPGKRKMSHLAHYAKDANCTGYGETAAHLLAKQILEDAVAAKEEISLPSVRLQDAFPHTFREHDPASTQYFMPVSAKLRACYLEHGGAEKFISSSKIPDAVVEIEYADHTTCIAIEIRNTHPKDLDDAKALASEQSIRGIIEIYVGDIQPDPDDPDKFVSEMKRRVLEADQENRYWLYNPKMHEVLDDYELCLYLSVPDIYQAPDAVTATMSAKLANRVQHSDMSVTILRTPPPDNKTVPVLRSSAFRGYAFKSTPGYMQGFLHCAFVSPRYLESPAGRSNVAFRPDVHKTYGKLSKSDEERQKAVEVVRGQALSICEQIRQATRDEIRSSLSKSHKLYVPTDIIDDELGCSVTDYLTYRQCPSKPLCMLRQSEPRNWYALCECQDDCQFSLGKEHCELMNFEDTPYSMDFTICGNPKVTRQTPGFRSSLDFLIESMCNAQFICWYQDLMH